MGNPNDPNEHPENFMSLREARDRISEATGMTHQEAINELRSLPIWGVRVDPPVRGPVRRYWRFPWHDQG